jgi:4-hydroxybenzoate polyprenyltransferase
VTRPTVRDLVELVRLPAALSVPGDALTGAAAARAAAGVPGAGPGRGAWALPAASVAFYWAGMALNDYADRDLDAVERPERPIPSGRVRPGQALGLATGLTVAGLGLAAAAGGRRAMPTAVALAGVVWAYDLVLKHGPLGPVAMGAARGLDVLLGAGESPRAAALPAAVMALHTTGVTALSRGEVHGAKPATAALATAATAVAAIAAVCVAPARATLAHAIPTGAAHTGAAHTGAARTGTARTGATGTGATSAAQPGRSSAPTIRRRVLTALLATTYAAAVGTAQARAIRSPDAGTVRTATGAGIRGMMPLQAALLAAYGAPRTALGLIAAGPVARAATSVVSPT